MLNNIPDPATVEAMAMKEAVILTLQLGHGEVMIEGDAKALVDLVKDKVSKHKEVHLMVLDAACLAKSFVSCPFSHLN